MTAGVRIDQLPVQVAPTTSYRIPIALSPTGATYYITLAQLATLIAGGGDLTETIDDRVAALISTTGLLTESYDDASGALTLGVAAASQAEAEAGVASNKAMTPQRVAQAIAALVVPSTGILFVRDEKASGTAGGTSSNATEHTRALNTSVLTTTIAGASLGTNQFTLPAGTFDVFAEAPVVAGDANHLRLYNVTDATYVAQSTNFHAASGAAATMVAMLRARLVLTGSKVFELRHYITNGRATDGLGRAMSRAGINEIFSQVFVRKVG